MAGLSSVVPFLPLFIRELGIKSINDTAYWSGLVFAGPFMISFFITPIWGSLGDKYGRKSMTVRAVFGLALSQILLGFSQNVVQLFIFRILQGVLSGFYAATIALIATNTPKEKTGYALGVVQSASTSGNIVGPLIGGILSNMFGYRIQFFIVGGIIFILSFFVTFFVVEKEESKSSKENYSSLDNWKFLLRHKELRLLGLLITLSAFGIAVIRPLFVLYVETFNINKSLLPTITGVLLSIVGIFAAISSAVFGKKIDSSGIKNNLVIASLGAAVFFAVQFFIYDLVLLIIANVFLGLSAGIIIPSLFTAISKNSVEDRKGGLMGIATSFNILGNLIGPLSAGFFAGLVNLRFSFIIAGINFFIISFLTKKFLKE